MVILEKASRNPQLGAYMTCSGNTEDDSDTGMY
jgi:hypothetical protein